MKNYISIVKTWLTNYIGVVKLKNEQLKNWIQKNVPSKPMLGFGCLLMVIAFYMCIRQMTWWFWGVMIWVGFIELFVIWAYKLTLTGFWRSLYPKRWDNPIMLILIPVVWWQAGELAAAFFLMGFLNNHLHEKEK